MPDTTIFDGLKTALASTGYKFAHYAWRKGARELLTDHGVWGEDNELSLYANNVHGEMVMQGTVDYYTRDDSDSPRTTIEAALTTYGIPWRLNGIQFENDTGFIHYEWVFEVPTGA